MNKRDHILNGVLVGAGVGFLLAPPAAGSLAEQVWGLWRSVIVVTVPVTLGALFPDADTEFGTHRKTLHNIPVLGLFVAFPYVFNNLQYVWIGVLTHYVLDVMGSGRGIALWYPLDGDEFNLPTGVSGSSRYAGVVTLVITAFELVVAGIVVIGSV